MSASSGVAAMPMPGKAALDEAEDRHGRNAVARKSGSVNGTGIGRAGSAALT